MLCKCLGILSDASDMLSESNYPSLALVYPVLDSFHFYLNSPSGDEVELSIKTALIPAFEKYIQHSSDLTKKNLILQCQTNVNQCTIFLCKSLSQQISNAGEVHNVFDVHSSMNALSNSLQRFLECFRIQF